MFKKLTIIVTLVFCFCLKAFADNGTVISNNFFSFTMPEDTKGTYEVSKADNGIYITEKVSTKEGLIGLAFCLKIYKNVSDYVYADNCKKIGELIDKNGVIYDMVLERPTDVVLSEGEEVQKNFDRLYEVGNNLEIKGINGSKYFKGKGMKGEDLYGGIIKKYKKAFGENWDLKKYEKESIGSAYYNLKQTNPKTDLMKEIGYAYCDINSDEIDELIIGTNKKGKSYIYDVYTMVNRKPAHVTSSDVSDKLFVCNDSFLCEEYQKDKTYNTFTVYLLDKNSTKQNVWMSLKYDTSKNAKMKRAVRYRNSYGWEAISKKEYKNLIEMYKDYKKFNFTPFSELK